MTPTQGETPSPDLSFSFNSFNSKRKQRRPGPDVPKYAILPEHWPDVLRRIEQGETYRQIAEIYGTSYQTIYRTIQKLRKQQRGGQA